MNNKLLIEMIKEKFSEQKMTAEYKLQLNKIVELEDKFTKDFSKEQFKKYLELDIEKGELQTIEINHMILFIIEFFMANKVGN